MGSAELLALAFLGHASDILRAGVDFHTYLLLDRCYAHSRGFHSSMPVNDEELESCDKSYCCFADAMSLSRAALLCLCNACANTECVWMPGQSRPRPAERQVLTPSTETCSHLCPGTAQQTYCP
jgi:hypothetical protein